VPSSSGAEEDDQLREAQAYNSSIYLMVGMPYLLLGTVGFLIYRGVRKNSRPEPLPADPLPGGGEGGQACSPQSPAGAS
jgi:hypothetical protein